MSDNVVENDIETASEDAVSPVVDERSDVERERDEYLETLQRLQAEFENYRKRVARSSEDAAARGACFCTNTGTLVFGRLRSGACQRHCLAEVRGDLQVRAIGVEAHLRENRPRLLA